MGLIKDKAGNQAMKDFEDFVSIIMWAWEKWSERQSYSEKVVIKKNKD